MQHTANILLLVHFLQKRVRDAEGCGRATPDRSAAEPKAARPVATGWSLSGVEGHPWLPATPDTNRKIDAGKKQWDDKFKTFLTSKQNWQDEIKAAAMEQSLEKMLGATGSALNERLKALSANINIPVDVPEINVANLVQAAMADFERSKPSNERLFGEINKSITAFNVTLELGNATHFKGFNSTSLEGDFASNMETFSKKMAILNNVKMYESFKKLIEDFKESLRKNDQNVTAGLTTAATLANYRQDGGWYTKDMGWAFGGKYGFSAYQHADVDGLMNRGMREAGMTIMSGDEMVNFLEKGRDVDVKLFFDVQTMALEQAFKIVGGDKSKKGLYGEWVGEAPQYNDEGDESNQGSGELGGWAGGQMDNKKTYRGLNKEEKRLSTIQGSITAAMNVTASLAAAATGNVAMLVTIAGAQATATTGTALSQGRDAGGTLAMGAIDFGIAFGGALMGPGVAATAIRSSVGFARAGIAQNPDGTINLDFKGNWSKGGGASALLSGAAAVAGEALGKYGGLSEKLSFATGAVLNAAADGVRFDSGGFSGFSTASAIGSLAGSAVSYGFNPSLTESGSLYGGKIGAQILSSEVGKLAQTLTTSLLGSAMNDTRAAGSFQSSYQTTNGFSSLGGILGRVVNMRTADRAAEGQAQLPTDASGVPMGNAVAGAAAQVATRRRDFLDDILDVTDSVGEKVGGAFTAATNWTKQNLLDPIGNFMGNAASGIKNFFSPADSKLASASGVIPREHNPADGDRTRWERNAGLTMTDAPIESISAYPEEKSIWAKIGGALGDAASWVGDQIESSYNWLANRGYRTGEQLTAIEQNEARKKAEGIDKEEIQPDGRGGLKKVTTYKAGGTQEMPISADDAASLAALAPVKGVWTEAKESIVGAWNTLVNRGFLPESWSSSTTKKVMRGAGKVVPNTLNAMADAAERQTLASQNVTDSERMLGNFQMAGDAPYTYMCLPYSPTDYPNGGKGMLTPADLMDENAGEFINDKTGAVSKTNPPHKPETGIMGALTQAGNAFKTYAQPSLDSLQNLAMEEFKTGKTSWIELLSTLSAAVPVGIIYAKEGNINGSASLGPIKFSAETDKGVLKNWSAETGVTIPLDSPAYSDSQLNFKYKYKENLNLPSGPNNENTWEFYWKARFGK